MKTVSRQSPPADPVDVVATIAGIQGILNSASLRPASPEMRLVHLSVENYRALRHADIEFPDGLIGILGTNGAGKTTVTEAIAVALTGIEASRTGKEDALTRSVTGDVRIELTFTIGGNRYIVRRQIFRRNLSTTAELELDGTVIARGTEPVTAEIARLVGSYQNLMLSRFVRQKQVNALSSYDPAPRKRLILNLLGIGSVEDAIKTLRERGRTFDADLKARRSLLPNLVALDAREAEAKRSLAMADAAIASDILVTAATANARKRAESDLAIADAGALAVASEIATIDLVRESLAGIEAEEKIVSDRLTVLGDPSPELAVAETVVTETEAALPEYRVLEEIRAQRGRIAEISTQIDSLDHAIVSDLARVAVLSREAAEAETIDAAIEAADERIIASSSRIAQTESIRAEARGSIMRIRTERTRLEAQRDAALLAGATCPTCGAPIADPTELLRQIEENLTGLARDETAHLASGTKARDDAARASDALSGDEEIRASLISRRRAAEDAATEVRLLRGVIADREEALAARQGERDVASAIPYDEARHLALTDLVENYGVASGRVAELRQRVFERDRLTAEKARFSERRATLAERRASAAAAASAAGYDPSLHEAARMAADVARSADESARIAATRHAGEQAVAAITLSSITKEREDHARLTGEIAQIATDRGTLDLARETMERFKIDLIGRIRPVLERKASLLLRAITEGRYTDLALDEDYEISIGLIGHTYPIKSASGGEEDLANLCLRLAISELVTEATGIGRTFVVLDEVLGSQDAQRQEAIMTMLANLSGHFVQIIMISHTPTVQDRFSAVIDLAHDPSTATSVARYPAILGGDST